MAVSLQTASVASWAGTLDSTAPYGHNVPVTVAGGINRILIVLVGGYSSAYTATFDGVAMTLGAHTSMVDAATHAGLFYMINPPVGTYNVSVNDASWQGHSATVTAFVLDGVDQTTPFGASSTSENPFGGSPTSASLTSASDGALVSILSVYSGSEPSIVANPGTALTAQLSNTSNFYSRSSYILGAATSIGFTFGGSSLQTGLVAVVVNAASGGNAAPTFTGPNIGNQTGTVGTALSNNNVASKFSDSDALTFSAVGSWPPGVTVSSAGVISGTPTAAGAYAGLAVRATDTAAQTVDSDTFSFTISAAAHLVMVANSQQVNTGSSAAVQQAGNGTITLPALKDWGTGNLKANETGVTIIVNNATTGALVNLLTGQTANASGVLPTLTGLVSGTAYRVTTILADGSEGTWKYTAS